MKSAPALREFWTLAFSAGGSPVTKLLSQRFGAVLAWVGMQLGLSPSIVTVLGVAAFLAGGAIYLVALSELWPAVWCFLLFQLGYSLDCADGQLARATGKCSRYGAWLDIACDQLRNVLLAGMVAGYAIAQDVPYEFALVGTGVLLSGLSLQLLTVTVLRAEDVALSKRSYGTVALIRAIVMTVIDTPVLIVWIVIARKHPDYLPWFALLYGLGYISHSFYLANRRVR